MSFDDLIKFRAPGELAARLERIAQARRRKLPDLLRIVLEDYAADEEKQLGLPALKETSPPYKTGDGISSKRKAELDAKVEQFVLATANEVKKRKRKKSAKT